MRTANSLARLGFLRKQIRLILFRWRDVEMFVCQLGCFPTPWSPLDEPFLDQIWFVDFFDCSRFLPYCNGERVDSDWPTIVLLDDALQDTFVHIVKAVFINFESDQRMPGNLLRDHTVKLLES